MLIIIFLWLFILLLIYLLLKQLQIKKNFIICFFICIIIILFVLNMEGCILAALEGCNLVLKAIIPTILPFCIICNLLIQYDGIELFSKILGPIICKPLGLSKNASFPIVASFLCGYPLGAKYLCDVYKNGYITRNEFIRLSNIASNAGPIFLIGAIGTVMLNSIQQGYILLISNYLSVLFIGLIFRKNTPSKKIVEPKFTESNVNFGHAMKRSIDNAISTTLNVATYVIVFSILINIVSSNEYVLIIMDEIETLLNLPNNTISHIFLGSIEFTNGAKLISSLSFNTYIKLSIISFLCSFSGLSIIAQVSSFFSEFSLPMKRYISIKFLQGIISFLITYFLCYIFLPTSITTSTSDSLFIFDNYYVYSISIVGILLFFLFISIFFSKIKK